jgi:hypothetical protein
MGRTLRSGAGNGNSPLHHERSPTGRAGLVYSTYSEPRSFIAAEVWIAGCEYKSTPIDDTVNDNSDAIYCAAPILAIER